MSETPFQKLEQEVSRFRDWADSHHRSHQCWECEYEEWPAMYTTFQFFLADCPYQTWDADTAEMLLYAIARDNESGLMAGEAANEPERLLRLTRAAMGSTERDAKWQLAVHLSHLADRNDDVEPVLLHFVRDEDEYVRRQALMGLGRIDSPAVEDCAEAAWESGHEYQRIGALYALHRVGSPRLAEFRDRAAADGRKYVVDYARRTRLDEKN